MTSDDETKPGMGVAAAEEDALDFSRRYFATSEYRGFFFKDALAAFLTTRDAAREAEQWRPIETAPKDGTHIIGYWKKSDTMSIVYFSEDDTVREAPEWWRAEDDLHVSRPSHWQPLPSPPLAHQQADTP